MANARDRRTGERPRLRFADTLSRYRLADGRPAAGWSLAPRPRLLAAWLLDLVLVVVTLGVGWLAWSYVTWGRGTTPGRSLLGLTVFSTDDREPCPRARMARRTLLLGPLSFALAVATLGGSWVYGAVVALGERHQTLVDEWAATVVLAAPRPAAEPAAAAAA